ncbi:MAG: type II toxin-antitoxin system RelE family toxin [Chloroflexota bacterium]
MYRIIILPKALRSLESFDKAVARRIINKLSWLSENFDDLTPLPLRGGISGTYKLRVGDWRVIYSFDIERRSITIHVIGHRREIYRLP